MTNRTVSSSLNIREVSRVINSIGPRRGKSLLFAPRRIIREICGVQTFIYNKLKENSIGPLAGKSSLFPHRRIRFFSGIGQPVLRRSQALVVTGFLLQELAPRGPFGQKRNKFIFQSHDSGKASLSKSLAGLRGESVRIGNF